MPQYNNAQMRRWLIEFFTDEEDFDFFTEDNFEAVFEQFETGMSHNKKARLLSKHCEDNGLYDRLLSLLKNEDPARYAELPPPDPLPEASVSQESPAVQSAEVVPQTESSGEQNEASTTDSATSAELPATPQGQDIFISYSRRDLAFVTQLHQELTGRGISAWFDKENIQVADHWRTSIVEGIRDCKVFVLVLSPDSTASVNVRKEVDLAERYKKQIVPLMWRETGIPVTMEYQLAGIQWIDFERTASQQNFNEFADVLSSLLGGATLTEAAGDKQVVKESKIDLDGLEKVKEDLKSKIGDKPPKPPIGIIRKPAVSPMAVGGSVISSLVTTFGLDAPTQDFVSGELKWLFSATSNFVKIRRGEIDREQPVKIEIPPHAERTPQADNTLLDSVDDFDLQIWEGQIESGFKRINTHLRNLDILLDQEARKGDAGKGDVYLQNQIKGSRLEIVKILQEMAQLMNQAYGIRVTSPDQLVQLLG